MDDGSTLRVSLNSFNKAMFSYQFQYGIIWVQTLQHFKTSLFNLTPVFLKVNKASEYIRQVYIDHFITICKK